MKQLTCEMCGSTDLVKQEGVFVCQSCGTKYSVEEARKMMVEGTVEVRGTVTVDNSSAVEKYVANARRALDKQDWEEVEKYYNLVEQNSTNNIEAVFFSSYGKAMLSMMDQDYFKRQQKFEVLNRSMSVISDYFEETSENKEEVLRLIYSYISYMYTYQFVYQQQEISVFGALRSVSAAVGTKKWCVNLINGVKDTFLEELKQIAEKHDEPYIRELISNCSSTEQVIADRPTASGLLQTVQCIGATVFNTDRKLYIYSDHIVLKKDSGEIIFSHNYRDVKCLKNGGFMAPTMMSLVLNDGAVQKFKLNGNDPAMVKIAKELPDYIDKLIHG
ncbi:MAG: TFIIB-type zinc finger domain-containing protein [Eubacteriales bacterium]|nr:TFIIB-type zinc finger domain-containing protein [Eubacteriales bacterium]